MKLVRSSGLFVLVAALGFAAEPVIEFRGVMVGDGPTKLSLVDKSSDTTRWVEVGQVFLGYTVKAYDPAIETATLTRMGKNYCIRINSSKIEEATSQTTTAALAPSTPKISVETARAIFINLSQISAAADQYYLKSGKSSATVEDLVGETSYVQMLKPLAGENYRALKLVAGGGALSVTTTSGETVTYDPAGKASSFYAIQNGDTLGMIARRFSISTSDLAVMNQITDPTRLRSGQLLRTK